MLKTAVDSPVAIVIRPQREQHVRQRCTEGLDAGISPSWKAPSLSSAKRVKSVITSGRQASLARYATPSSTASSISRRSGGLSGVTSGKCDVHGENDGINAKLEQRYNELTQYLSEIQAKQEQLEREAGEMEAAKTSVKRAIESIPGYSVPPSATWPKPYHTNSYLERYWSAKPQRYTAVQHAHRALHPSLPVCSQCAGHGHMAQLRAVDADCTCYTHTSTSIHDGGDEEDDKPLISEQQKLCEAVDRVKQQSERYRVVAHEVKRRQLRVQQSNVRLKQLQQEAEGLKEKAVASSYCYAHTTEAKRHKDALWAAVKMKEQEVTLAQQQVELCLDMMALPPELTAHCGDLYDDEAERDCRDDGVGWVEVHSDDGDDNCVENSPTSTTAPLPLSPLMSSVLPCQRRGITVKPLSVILREQEYAKLKELEVEVTSLIDKIAAVRSV